MSGVLELLSVRCHLQLLLLHLHLLLVQHELIAACRVKHLRVWHATHLPLVDRRQVLVPTCGKLCLLSCWHLLLLLLHLHLHLHLLLLQLLRL